MSRGPRTTARVPSRPRACFLTRATASTRRYGVRGYPTIKSFTGDPDGTPYEGGRDYASLKKFADESLGPSCSNDNIDLCDDEQKAILDKYNAMSADERKKIVDEANAKVAEAEETFKSELKKLQAEYEALNTKKEADIKALQTPELRLLKTIKGDSKDELCELPAAALPSHTQRRTLSCQCAAQSRLMCTLRIGRRRRRPHAIC